MKSKKEELDMKLLQTQSELSAIRSVLLSTSTRLYESESTLSITQKNLLEKIHQLDETNYLLAEESMAFTRKEDEERVVYINRLKEEYKSYNDYIIHTDSFNIYEDFEEYLLKEAVNI